jgi:glycosyltransferase involved in cell wall biosynthesis
VGDIQKPKLIMVLTEDWFFCSHFLERTAAAREAGYEVIVLANDNGKSAPIRAAGLQFVPIPLKRRGLNPLSEIKTLRAILAIYRRVRPDLTHHIGLKPVLLGALAARLAGIRAMVNAPIGMGFVFTSKSLMSQLLRPVVWLALRLFLNPRGSKVIFENSDDLNSLVEDRAVRAGDAVLIRGSGINVADYAPGAPSESPPVVSLVSRMLWDKGVGEFVEAARKLRNENVPARFWLVGAADPQNPAAISERQLSEWRDEGTVEWLGHRDDIPAILAQSQIACLPSYREGLPRSLLEAMAAGLPIVSTDVPGCREAVQNGENGLLVPARDSAALAAALRALIDDPALRKRFGAAGRARAEREFASAIVIAQTLAVYAELRGDGNPPEPANAQR